MWRMLLRIASHQAADPQCGGLAVCPRRLRQASLALKCAIVEDALGRIGRLRGLPTIDAVGSPGGEWRLRTRLHAHGAHVGFYREGTHSLCDRRAVGATRARASWNSRRTRWTRLRPELTRGVEAVVVSQTVRGDQQAVHLELSRPLPRHGEVWVQSGPPTGLHRRERRPHNLAASRPRCTGIPGCASRCRRSACHRRCG